MPRIEGECPPSGFTYLPTDVFQFPCRNAGCDKIQRQDSPVREFHVGKTGSYKGAKPGAAPVDWWWCDTCRTCLRQGKKKPSNTANKLAQAALDTSKIQWPRREPPAV